MTNEELRLLFIFLFGIIGYYATKSAIPVVSDLFISKGLVGKDLLKAQKPLIAESMGTIVGSIYFGLMFIFIPIGFLDFQHSKEFIFEHEKVSIVN